MGGFKDAGESTSSDKRDLVDVITSKENDAMVDDQDHRSPSATGGKRDSISRIMQYINDGAGNNTHLQHKRHVIVLGLTGSGKSTTINSLAGCKLRRVTEEEANRFQCSTHALVVACGVEGCGRKEVTKIGNWLDKSQTEVLQAVAVDEKDEDPVPTFFLFLIIMSNISLDYADYVRLMVLQQEMEMEQEELGGVGLENLGNTCYMAAFLQVLVRAHSFTHCLLRLPRLADTAVLGDEDDVHEGVLDEGVLDEVVLQELQRMMAMLLLSKRRSWRPEGLLSALRRKAGGSSRSSQLFQEGHQQDAGEAGRHLFERVDAHWDRLSIANVAPAASAKPTRVFQGKMQTRVTCKKCNRVSCTSEPFYDLTLSIPSVSDDVDMSGQEGSLRLEDLVSVLSWKEELCDANQYDCPQCDGKQDAVKQSLLEEVPEILIITLSRFGRDTAEKVCRFVEIPPSLSLRTYPSPGAPEEQAAVQYELFGVVTHEGSTRQSGHYYSFVRHLNETHWLRCDDSTVSVSSFQRAVNPTLKTETPYLLFYVRTPGLWHADAAAAAEATIHAIPPMLHTEVEEDNRLVHAIPPMLHTEGMILWDAPGFEDSNGPEQNIANAVNLQRLLKDSSHTGSGLAVLVVIDALSLEVGRGGPVKSTLDMLSQVAIAFTVA